MSPVNSLLPARESAIGLSNTQALDKHDFPLTAQPTAFGEPIIDKYYELDARDTMAASPNPSQSSTEVPELPRKSVLRASQLLDNLTLKMNDGVETIELRETIPPHDVYLSSEEDASSDTDDFSDFDFDYDDSSIEDPASPTTRSSQESTARKVSVVFSGKPSLVDLPATRKRPTSASSLAMSPLTRSRTTSAASSQAPTTTTTTTSLAITESSRPATPASSSSKSLQRKSVHLGELLGKKRPPFLNIDPCASSSRHEPLLESGQQQHHVVKTPRTPTTLLRGVTRSISLVRKRSRPLIHTASASHTAVGPSPLSATVPLSATEPPSRLSSPFQPADSINNYRNSLQSPATVMHVEHKPQQHQQQRREEVHLPKRPRTPSTPILFTEMIQAVQRSATMVESSSNVMSPTEPTPKKGLLSALAMRRRSIKIMGRPF